MMHGQYLKLSQLSDNFKAITEGNVHVLTSRSLDELEGIRGFNMPLGEDGAGQGATIQVYGNNHNSQSDRWIGLIFYVDSPDIFDYLGLKIQVNRSSGRNRNTVLKRTESDLSKINWLRGVILLIPIVLVPWGRFPLCHTPIRPILAFRDQISILIVGCVTT
ncbi:hypothetical protein NC652_034759 [Populus alba x Populus x berolinensis]|nr:hypothetical protein NC652_034759 [Populus alba x Populus x berolinensis]